ncbi:MAG: VWA domain-containing protein [Pseudomonadota bacterium]
MPWPRLVSCAAFATYLNAPSLLLAEEQQPVGRSYLLVDASGSMWGQIDGKSKIEILRRNMRSIVEQLRGSAEVGVFAFGHREKGACEDIEEVMPPQPFDGERIANAFDAISPKGKTPLAAAVEKAAEQLKYTEEKATIVILGDGRESCGGNPCEMAKRLEALGVDFTVHSVAFDIADQEGVEQLQCFAKETGGEFFVADDVRQLQAAIETVAVAELGLKPAPAPALKGLRLALANGGDDVEWTLINKATEEVIVFTGASGLIKTDLQPGAYEVYASVGAAFGEGEVETKPNELVEVVIALGEAGSAPFEIDNDASPAGAVFTASWTLDPAPRDIVFVAPVGQSDSRYPTDARRLHKVDATKSGRLVAPAKPGRYEVRYFSFAVGGVLYRSDLLVTAPGVSIDGPDEVASGKPFAAKVSGPLAPGDFVFIAPTQWKLNEYPGSNAERFSPGALVQFRAPGQAGAFEYRYFSAANGVSLFSKPLRVVTEAAHVDVADGVAEAGSIVKVDFSGPRHPKDVLFITPSDTAGNRYSLEQKDRQAALSQAPASLVAPAAPGVYEVRYYSPDHGGLLAKARLVVSEPSVSIDAPRIVTRGSPFDIVVTGPGAPGDIVYVIGADVGDQRYPGSRSNRFEVTGDGDRTFSTRAPANPGTYEVRYLSWSNAAVLERRKLIVK